MNSSRCVRVLTNFYSVPAPVGCVVEARVYAAEVELWHEGKCLARHDRCFSRQKKVFDLEHYLDALSKKPGALQGSSALEQWRAQGKWPASVIELERRHFTGAQTQACEQEQDSVIATPHRGATIDAGQQLTNLIRPNRPGNR